MRKQHGMNKIEFKRVIYSNCDYDNDKKKMIQLAEKHNLKVSFELDELKERF